MFKPSADIKDKFLDLAPVAIIIFCDFLIIVSSSDLIITFFESADPFSKYPKAL